MSAFLQIGQAPAGFRTFWRRWMGSDEGQDNAHLMRVAGRFSRRVRAWADRERVPLVHSHAGERNETISEPRVPEEAGVEGAFLIVVGRAPGVQYLLPDDACSPSRAAYDLRKLRCKGLVEKVRRSRRYAADASSLRAMAALLILRDRVLRPLMAAASRTKPTKPPRDITPLDLKYRAVHKQMQDLFRHLGIAA